MAPLARHVASLLLELPLRGGEPVLAGIELARRQFEDLLPQRIAVLALDQRIAVLEQRQDHGGARVVHILAHGLLAVR
jgi:hypothetical protein